MTQNSLDILPSVAGLTPWGNTLMSLAPAMGVNIQYMDDIQVDLLIKATQADSRAVTLTAPRLTFFNGQGAWISINKQEAYVAGLQASTGDASGAYVPQVAVLPTGIVLHLKGAVSVRQGDYKLIRRFEQLPGYPDLVELYDLTKDIGETRNLAGKMPKSRLGRPNC